MANNPFAIGLGEIGNDTDIAIYFERLRNYFTAAGTAANKQLPTLFCVMGESAYTTLRNLVLPEKVTAKSMDEIEEILQQHYSPAKSEVVYRLQF